MIQFLLNLKNLLLVLVFFSVSKNAVNAQCVQIESILVAACGTPEGQNEMFRFRVGIQAKNTNNLNINWPSQTWNGLVQNATTAAKVVTLNANIVSAGGCAQLLEPTGGVLPANAPVIVVTSFLFDTAANSFGALTEDTYILFHNSTTTGGHFGNYQPEGVRTLTVKFGTNCTESVSYTRSLLSQEPGAAVNYTPAGVATYYNNGCSAPVAPFTVDAGPATLESCAGTVVNLNGTSEGAESVAWTTSEGTFSNPTGLEGTFTIPPTASGIIAITLTATNSCGTEITDTISLTVTSGITPTFSLNSNLCNGETPPILPLISDNGISGTWSPATVSSTTSGSYVFTPATASCAVSYTLNVSVGNGIVNPTFNPVNPICAGDILAPLPTISTNGISGTWSPALDNTSTTTYTFTPTIGQCATDATLTVVVNTSSTPTFDAVDEICSGENLEPLPTISLNGISGTWSPAINNTETTTYTFTPNATNICATTVTLIITVNPVITPTFANVNAICEGENLTPLPTTSQNGVTGTWSPILNNLATTTYTFTPTAGQCANTITLTIAVNSAGALPTFAKNIVVEPFKEPYKGE